MGIGGSIALIAIGAILAFGVNVSVGWRDLWVVGWVLMLAGVVGLVLTLWFWSSRRRRTVTTRTPGAGTEYTSVEQRRMDVGPPDTL